MLSVEDFLRGRFRPTTVTRYLRALHVFQEALGEDNARHARYHQVMDHIGTLRTRKLGAAHISVELAGLKTYFRFLVKTGVRMDDPTRHIFLKDQRATDVQFQDLFSKEELELLLQRPTRYGILQWRNKLAISLYIYQGLVTGELPRLTVKDIDLDRGTIFVRASAKHCSRLLPLHANQVVFIERYLTFDRPSLLRSDTDMLFLSNRGTPTKGEDFHHLIESARGLFPGRLLNPITVRESVIVNLFREGKDIRDVQLFAGHYYASTTERYQPTDLSKLEGALERFHPLA
jgi:integrase/recombinase XerD